MFFFLLIYILSTLVISVLCVACCSVLLTECLWMTANHLIHNIPSSASVPDIFLEIGSVNLPKKNLIPAAKRAAKYEIRPATMKLNLNQPLLSLSLSLLRSSSTVKKINRWLDWQDVGMLLMTPLDPCDPCHKRSCDRPQQNANAAALTTCWSSFSSHQKILVDTLPGLSDGERAWMCFVSLWPKNSCGRVCRIRWSLDMTDTSP